VSETEGQTLLFLEQYRSNFLVVPILYAMYHLPSKGHMCLVMQRLPGDTLEHSWSGLDEDEKSEICTRLKSAIDDLRAIPTTGFYGGVGRTCIPYHLFWDPDQQKEICGPFDSEGQFNAALLRKLRDIDDMNNGCMTAKVEFYARNLDTMLGSHCPVFTHSDLQRKNVLVHRQPGKASKVSIIDWETAGWYPSYWEYSLKITTMQWTDDWPKYFEQIVETWPCEAAALRMIYQDLWF
jgi:aminoglycoside phosphotransferase (APT) family kinase protein